jgi:signal transduction histidine kinase
MDSEPPMPLSQHILIVDDRQNWRDLLHETLTAGGYNVTTAASTAEFRARFAERAYQLVVLDIRLAEDDATNTGGMEILRWLAQAGFLATVKVVMLTAYGTRDQIREAFRFYDVQDFLPKEDFDEPTFLQLVQTILAQPAFPQNSALIAQIAALDEELNHERTARKRVEAALQQAVGATDLTEQRLREATIMRSIGLSTYELTHRLANYLGVQRLDLRTLHRELDRLGITSEIAAQKIASAQAVTNEMGTFIRSVRESLKDIVLEEQHSSEKPQRASLQGILDRAANLFVLPSTIQLIIHTLPEDALVYIVPDQIDDILRNLITNAVEAMPEGGTIRLEAHVQASTVQIIVSDSGPGIPEPRQGRIFDLFYSTKADGSGFGLWSARRNALANGGSLEVRSTSGSGAVFILSLPRADQSSQNAPVPADLHPTSPIDTMSLSEREESAARESRRSDPRALLARNTELEQLVNNLQQREERRTRVLSETAHELRKPVTAIGATARNLLKGLYGELSEKQYNSIETIQRIALKNEHLINNLLARQNLETGKVNLQLTTVDIHGIIEEVLQVHAHECTQKSIHPHHELTNNLHLVSDRHILEQIIRNLVDNAIKFNRSGGNIWISAGSSGAFVEITIRDDGIGIPPEDQERIWEWEYQVGTSALSRGIGYGLPLVRGLATVLGGTVGLTFSAPNQGSIFRLTLPIQVNASAEED